MPTDDSVQDGDDAAPESAARPRRRSRSAGPGRAPEPDQPASQAASEATLVPAVRPGRAGSPVPGTANQGDDPSAAAPAAAAGGASPDRLPVPGFAPTPQGAAPDEPVLTDNEHSRTSQAPPDRSAGRSGRSGGWSTTGRPAPAHHAADPVSDPGLLLIVVNSLFVVLAVSLAAAALYGAHRAPPDARPLVLAAAAVASLAAVIAAGSLLVRLLTAARSGSSSRRPARRLAARVTATAAGTLLLAALALAGAAAAVAVVAPARSDPPALTLRTARDGTGRSIEVRIASTGLAAGAPVAVSLTALPVTGDGNSLLSSVVHRASGDAGDTVQLSARLPEEATSVQVDVSLTGRLCQAVIPVRVAVRQQDVQLTCTAG